MEWLRDHLTPPARELLPDRLAHLPMPRNHLQRFVTEIHGLGPSLALKRIGECGTDLRRWPSAKHFTSWLCLAPGNKVSGGKVLSSRTRRSSSRAAALLRLAATTVGRSDTA